MLATLTAKNDVKDIGGDNDPHDALDISPDVVLASRPEIADKVAPTLAPDATGRFEPKIFEPKISVRPESPVAAAASVDTAVRAALSDFQAARNKRSSAGKWVSAALLSMLLAGGSAAASIAWQVHGDAAKQMVAAWIPALAFGTSPAAPVTPAVAEQPAAPVPQAAAAEQVSPQPATAQAQEADVSTTASTTATPDASQAVQSMTRDIAAMGQQIEQLKANIAELKASQEQMARELAKASQPKPEARVAEPHPRISALPPRPPVAPVHKPKPVYTPAYAPTYAPPPIAPAPSQAAAMPPPPPPAQAVADDDGPVVRPPMPVR